jgi:hypothetical protein
MPRKRKPTEPPASREQPYDSSLRPLIEDQALPMLSYLFGEEVLWAQELRESLFKQDVVKPALRVDCLYDMMSRKSEQGPLRRYIGHVELETAPTEEIGKRMLDYRSTLHRKHNRPIGQVLACLFETTTVPPAPYFMQHEDGEVLLESRYRVIALWQEDASSLLAAGKAELYALLPTMKGATYEVLTQGIKAMRALYAGNEDRLRMHLLWFDTLLGRTTTVSEQDKERIRIEMSEHESLLDYSPFVQGRVAKARAEERAEALAEIEQARTKALAEGEARGLQEALVTVVELRFPTLLTLAQEKAKQVERPDTLKFALQGVKTASSEEVARSFLELLAA